MKKVTMGGRQRKKRIDESPREAAVDQLWVLLRRYPQDGLDIEGLILDYLGRTNTTMDKVFDINHLIYTSLFTGTGLDRGLKLLSAVGDSEVLAELGEKCKERYTVISDVVGEQLRKGGGVNPAEQLIENPSVALGYTPQCIVWHLSDVHFGSFNKIEDDPRQLAYTVAKLAVDHPTVSPDVIVISGDVSSVAAPGEFGRFRLFCTELSLALWGRAYPERILVVPGNHDVTWGPDGTADRMARFADTMGEDVCITPFGPAHSSFGGGRVEVDRSSPNPNIVAPFAVVRDHDKTIDFILLVSGYFSGAVPDAIRGCLGAATGTFAEHQDLLRTDKGEVSQEYLFHLSKQLTKSERLGIGVIHHNPVQYGKEISANALAPQLMETLWSRGVPVLLHGHIHLSEGKGDKRPATPGLSYPVPAPTLTSVTSAGSGRGLNVHFIGPEVTERRMDTVVWPYASSMAFQVADAVWKYRFRFGPTVCAVEHVA